MNPTQLSSALKEIANRLDASRNPDKRLVVASLTQLVKRIAVDPKAELAKASNSLNAVLHTLDVDDKKHKSLTDMVDQIADMKSSI